MLREMSGTVVEPLEADSCGMHVRRVQQAGDNWCWAACSEMLLVAHGRIEGQCQVATRHLDFIGQGCDDCCPAVERASPACDKACPEDSVADIFRRVGFDSSDKRPVLLPCELENELREGRALLVGFLYPSGRKHVAVLFRCRNGFAGARVYDLYDPDRRLTEVIRAESNLIDIETATRTWYATWTSIGRINGSDT